MDEFGPLNLLPRRGRQWAPAAAKATGGGDDQPRRRRRRATFGRPHGVRHLLAALDLATDTLYGHVKANKNRTTFLAFCRYLRSLYPSEVRIGIVLDNFSPHLYTKVDPRVGEWAETNNVEFAYVPTNASWPWSPLASDQHVADRVRVRALVLRYHEDLSVDQIADVIGARPGTVRSLIHRGHESLRKELDHG